jgi:hypothetical protein
MRNLRTSCSEAHALLAGDHVRTTPIRRFPHAACSIAHQTSRRRAEARRCARAIAIVRTLVEAWRADVGAFCTTPLRAAHHEHR